jgi:L-arabinose isomerase
MTSKKSKPKIGLLATMTPVYREIPSIQPKMEKWAQEIVHRMESFADVLYEGICDTRSKTESTVEHYEHSCVDLLIVFPITYAPSLMALPALKKTHIPLLVLNTQILHQWSSDAPPECFIDNQAPTGVFDLTSVLVRENIAFEIVSGHYKDEHLYTEIKEWALAASAVTSITSSRIGLLGYPMQGSGDFAIDYVTLSGTMGIDVIPIDLRELVDLYQEAPRPEITQQMDFDHKTFSLDTSLRKEAHEEASKMEWGLRELVKKYTLSGLTFHFEALTKDGRFVTMPMLGISKLLSEGIGFGGEGDITSTAAVTCMNALAEEVDFFESWGIDFAGEAILKNHMGEGNYKLARTDMPVRLVESPFGIGGYITYNVIPVFTLREGDATLVNLTTDNSGTIKIIAVEGDVLDLHPIQGVDSPHGKFKPRIGLQNFFTRFAHAGGTHHSALVYGSESSKIEKVARILNISFERF